MYGLVSEQSSPTTGKQSPSWRCFPLGVEIRFWSGVRGGKRRYWLSLCELLVTGRASILTHDDGPRSDDDIDVASVVLANLNAQQGHAFDFGQHGAPFVERLRGEQGIELLNAGPAVVVTRCGRAEPRVAGQLRSAALGDDSSQYRSDCSMTSQPGLEITVAYCGNGIPGRTSRCGLFDGRP